MLRTLTVERARYRALLWLRGAPAAATTSGGGAYADVALAAARIGAGWWVLWIVVTPDERGAAMVIAGGSTGPALALTSAFVDLCEAQRASEACCWVLLGGWGGKCESLYVQS